MNTDAMLEDSHAGDSAHRFVREFLDIRCMDCMELMAEYPDKHFDLAIVTIALAKSNKSAKVST